MTLTTSMISDFKFSTQLISTVFLVGIAVFEVSSQYIRRCLVYRFRNGFFHSLHLDLSFARVQVFSITDASVSIYDPYFFKQIFEMKLFLYTLFLFVTCRSHCLCSSGGKKL